MTAWLCNCHGCGALQRMPIPALRQRVACIRCRGVLSRTHGRNLDAALACASATVLLLIPANLLPFLTTSILGASRQSVLGSSMMAFSNDGFPDLGLVFGLCVVVLPLLRFGLLTAVLALVRLGRRPHWLGRAFRFAMALRTWAMPDVFLLGFVVAYGRLATSISVEIGLGAWCFVGAAVLSLLTRATLDSEAVWRAITPPLTPTALSAPAPADAPTLACDACGLVQDAAMQGRRCPRCAARLHLRKPDATARATALTLAAALMYLPANLYPMATLPVGLTSVSYTVLAGVIELTQVGLVGLALLVLVASFVIPLLKLAVLAWCITSVLRRSGRLVAKTRLYRVVEEIGRWSMVDPFVIACFVPVTQYSLLVHGSAEPAAPAFTAVVILTTLAAHAFDPRLMWDAARRSDTP